MSNENPERNFEKPPTQIRLGSTSAHKLEALKEACEKLGLKVEIQGSPAESRICTVNL